jgi:hypothetical protein
VAELLAERLLAGAATPQAVKPNPETKGGNWQAWLLDALALGLALFGVAHVARVLPSRAISNDFAHYYISSRLLLTGRDVYTTPLPPEYERWGFRYGHVIPTATNPPLLVDVFAPFAALPPRAAFWAWALLEIVSLGCVLVVIWRLTPTRVSGLAASRLLAPVRRLVCAGIIASAPVYWHFYFSQSQLLIAAIILIAYACLRNGKPVTACLAITTAAWLKLYPVMLVPWFLWRASRDWNISRKCAGAALAWSVGIVLASGPGQWNGFWTYGMKVLEAWAEWQRHFNFTVPSFVKNTAWLLHGFDPEWAGLHSWAQAGAIIGLVLIILLYGVNWWTGRGKESPDIESEFCLLTIAMLAGIAEGWGHYFVMLAFPVAVAVARVVQRTTSGRVIALGASLVMLNVMGSWRSPWLEFTVSYIPLYGLLLLGAFFVNELRSSQPITADPTKSVPQTP